MALKMLTILVFFFGSLLSPCQAVNWTYRSDLEGHIPPHNWSSIPNSQCGGASQSPINLLWNKERNSDGSYTHVFINSSMRPIDFNSYDSIPTSPWNIENTGHTIVLSATFSSAPTISGGPLQGTYTFAEVHFHWGFEENPGSQHLVDYRQMPAEMHFFHFHSSYANLSSAIDSNANGAVAIVSSFIDVMDKDRDGSDFRNYALETLFNSMINVKYRYQTTSLASSSLKLRDMLSDSESFHEDYAHYTGSLTTPLCNEVVSWIVLSHRISISSAQLRLLNTQILETESDDLAGFQYGFDSTLINNFRPIQALNGRKIHYTSEQAGESMVAASNGYSLSIFILGFTKFVLFLL